MSQNAGRATPSTILRKRDDKENEAREAKRSKMRSRRVSFAPDDELHTMHLYEKDNRKASKNDDLTDDSIAGLGAGVPYTFPEFPAPPQQQPVDEDDDEEPAHGTIPPPPGADVGGGAASMLSPAPHQQHAALSSYLATQAVLPSPGMAGTPLSMDLTNNSFSMHAGGGGMQDDPAGGAASSVQQHEFTRNITSCVPGLSTLIEEDEDGAAFDTCAKGKGTSAAAAEQQQHAPGSPPSQTPVAPAGAVAASASAGDLPATDLSPISPFVMQEMRLAGSSAAAIAAAGRAPGGTVGPSAAAAPQEDSEDMKNKWGFTPGAEDTLEVSNAHLVMGEATYNNVYGNATLGEITRAMRGGQATGFTGGAASLTFRPALATAAAAAATGASSARPPSQKPASAADDMDLDMDGDLDDLGLDLALTHAAQRRQSGPMPEMTLNLLAEEQQQTAAWRQATAAFAQGQQGGSQGQHASLGLEKQRVNDTTNLLNGSVMRGGAGGRGGAAAAAAVAGAAGGGATATGFTGFTAHLLGESSLGLAAAGCVGQQNRQQSASRPEGLETGDSGDVALGVSQPDSQKGPARSESLQPASGVALLSQQHLAAMQAAAGEESDAEMDLETDPASAMKLALRNTASMLAAPGSASRGHNHHSAAFLADQSLTLDAFARPPELPGSAASSPAPAAAARRAAAFPLQQQPSDELRSSGDGDGNGSGALQQLKNMLVGNGVALAAEGAAAVPPPVVAPDWRGGLPPLAPSSLRKGAPASHQKAAAPDARGYALTAAELQAASPYMGASAAAMRAGFGGGGMTPSRQQQQQQQQALAARSLPSMSFSEFLQLVEIPFMDDLRRRTSIIHSTLADMQPDMASQQAVVTTMAEALEVLHVSGPRARLSQATIDELAQRTEALQARVVEAETSLAKANPPVFAAVQLASANGLKQLQDQMKLLKRVCRLRTQMAWKQRRIEFEQLLNMELRKSMAAVQQEVTDMEAMLQGATRLESAASDLHVAATQRVQQEQVQAQAAQDQRQRRRLALRQLQDLQASNEQRAARLAASQQQHGALRARFEEALQAKATRQHELQELRSEGVLQETPGKRGAGAGVARGSLVHRLLQRQEQLEVLMGVQGLQLDARDLAGAAGAAGEGAARCFSLTLRSQFHVSVAVPAAGAPCKVSVSLLPGAAAGSPACEALAPHLLSAAVGGGEGFEVPREGLRAALGRLMVRLANASCIVAQLDALLLSLPHFARVAVVAGGEGSVDKGVADKGALLALQLVFVNAEAGVRAVASLPVTALALGRLTAGPLPVEVRVDLCSPGGLGASGVEAALRAALAAALRPGPAGLQQACCVVHDVVQGLAAKAGGPGPAAWGAAGSAAACPTQGLPVSVARTPLRVYDGLRGGPFGM